MSRRFDLCVIFAEMRTGSNHLEAILSGHPEVQAFGELFNPAFIGGPKQETVLGFDLERREADPLGLLSKLKAETGSQLPLLRFFHDHDPRVLEHLLQDSRTAKIILRRNPLDSYISRKIAAETGQWKLTDARGQKSAEVAFDAAEFETMLAEWSGFSGQLRRGLQRHGQTAFEIDYADLGDADALNGVLRFLGLEGAVDLAASNLKPQNPGGPLGKVANPEVMESALSRLDPFGLGRPRWAETTRQPAVKRWVVSDKAQLMVLPVPGVPVPEFDDARSGMNQRELRQWMRRHPGHQRISILQHPLTRAHDVFCHTILPHHPAITEARRKLRNRYSIPLPEAWPDPDYSLAAHRAAFGAFLEFLSACLAGQTSLAARPDWDGQMATLQGMAGFAVPDRVLRAETLAASMPGMKLAQSTPFPLADIYDEALEGLARNAYRRDYVLGGYSDWPAMPPEAWPLR